MKTIKKTIEIPQLSIFKEPIEETPQDFITNNIGAKCAIYVDNNKSIYNTEKAKRATSGRGYIFNIRIGYSNDIYLKDKGYPVFGQGYSSGKIRIYKEKEETRTKKEILEDLDQYIQFYNTGIKYGFKLLNEKGNEVDSCFDFYELEAIRDNLPKEWKNENLEDYLLN